MPHISSSLYIIHEFILGGLFPEGFIFGEVIIRMEYGGSNWIWISDSRKAKVTPPRQIKTDYPNSPWVYIRKGFTLEEYLRPKFGGLICGS